MPYIITTRRPYYSHDACAWATWESPRHAVATLDEARAVAHELVIARDPGFSARAEPLTVPGTVGPLPDGTVITVEQDAYNAARA
jgi:hypothetical protein